MIVRLKKGGWEEFVFCISLNEDNWRSQRLLEDMALETELRHENPDVNENELEYLDGKNEVFKNFNEQPNLCLSNPITYAFRMCGYQWLCESYGALNVDLLKCAVCTN